MSLLRICTSASAQTSKGLTICKPVDEKMMGKTYALIIGISKYKNPDIQQLEFADKDAVAFRNYLLATGVDSNNIILLTNENARYADIMLDLDEICTQRVKPGDKMYFYFSGHGDVESHVITNDGYLLPYDAPKFVYAISALNVKILQSYIATLSAKGVRPIVITDACHSGNLAGGIEGLKNIQNVLKENWKDEVKILSCQPGELSLEGKQWGNGRGLFSYELMNGMAGMADKNKDGNVSLRELNLYLMEKVPDGANPLPQNPVVNGDMGAIISNVNQPLLASFTSHQNNYALTAIDVKGMDESLLAGQSNNIKQNYKLYKLYLDSGIYVKATLTDTAQIFSPSAYYYYNKIPANDSTRLLLALMKRNLGAGIINSANQLLNNFISAEMNTTLPMFSQRTIEVKTLRQLFGDDLLKKIGFMSKVYFFETNPLEYHDSARVSIIDKKIDSALLIDPEASYIYNWKAFNVWNHIQNPGEGLREAVPYAQKAISLSPGFAYCYNTLSFIYRNAGKYDSAIITGRQLLNFGSKWEVEGYKAVGFGYYYWNVLKDTSQKAYLDSANYYFTKIIDDPHHREFHSLYPYRNYNGMGDLFLMLNLTDKAIRCYQKAIKTGGLSGYSELGIARCLVLQHKEDEALTYLEKSFALGYKRIDEAGDDFNYILNNLKSTARYKVLEKKYFFDK